MARANGDPHRTGGSLARRVDSLDVLAGSHTLSHRLLLTLLLTGALARIAVLPLAGTVDVEAYKLWTYAATTDFSAAYGIGGTPPERGIVHWQDLSGAITYPPMALIELAAMGHLYHAIRPAFTDSTLFTVLVKLPGLLSETLFVALLLTWGRRLMGSAAADWSAMAFWLSPGVWFIGPGLGYFDAPAGVPITLALLCATTNRPRLVGLLAAVSILIKPQAVFLVPVIAVLLLQTRPDRNWRALGLTAVMGTLTTAVIVLPFVIRGAFLNLMQAMSRLLQHDMLSAQAANLGWIGTWILRVLPGIPDLGWHRALTMQIRILSINRIVELGYPNPRLVGTMLTTAALIWATWRAWRGVSRAGGAALAAWSAYAYMMLGAQVHENHLYMVLPILAVAAGELPSLRPVFWWVSAILVLNIHLFEGFGRGLPSLLDRRWTFVDMTVVLSVVNLGVFVWFTRRVAALTRVSGV